MPGATRLLLLFSSPLSLLRHRHHKLLPPSPSSLSLLTRRHHHLHLTRHLHFHQLNFEHTCSLSFSSPDTHRFPAWSSFIHFLSSQNYFSSARHQNEEDYHIVACNDLPHDFVRSAYASLAFARDRPFILRLLPRRDVEVVVENVRPVLFQNGEDSMRRLRAHLSNAETSGLDTDRAETVDLMRLLLSYLCNLVVSSEKTSSFNSELLEACVQNLLSEFAKHGHSSPDSRPRGPVQNQYQDAYAKSPRPFGQNIEMKRGDWICPRCSFMNFARNMKCLECEEPRPKRQLTGGEWECPQCGFVNYVRNMACIRCDCKRPREVSLHSTNLTVGSGYSNGNTADKTDLKRRIAANEEKAQRWFSKISQLDATSDMSSAIADEDFPEIMPLRKGVNRFVVSTRKTPLERRLANAQYRRNLGNNGSSETYDTKISRTLDEILGRKLGISENKSAGQATETNNSSPIPGSQHGGATTSNSSYESSTLLSSDPKWKLEGEMDGASNGNTGTDTFRESSHFSEKSGTQADKNGIERDGGDKSEGWLEKIADLHSVKNMSNEISDDVPEIMPMQEGENRFVVSKKKDRSLTSPIYKRGTTMGQTGDPNFVPFVPFPPGYFARKETQPMDDTDSTDKATDQTSNLAMQQNPFETTSGARPGTYEGSHMRMTNNQHLSAEVLNSELPGPSSIDNKTVAGTLSQDFSSQVDSRSNWSGGHRQENVNNERNCMNMSQPAENQNIRGSWTGKSLEGSAIKEPDPLDMSEEAKAERWFRRVAQIKDISELSQIPDEDFPSIMPMRKGVNRFVVSKRKTPLERRLTSSQYRRNLPVVTSDPLKNENDKKKENE